MRFGDRRGHWGAGGRRGPGGLAAEQIEQCIWQFAAGSREEEEAAEGLGGDIPYR